ncbi:MAG: bifunctional phosphoribosylaminoimidazolecarboxamide formyltransferase/inosine monophosphate cyclohydrolase, partial [Flammeovirgaceae bacterium TMED290]
MTKKIFPKTVLFSVSDKRGLVPFAKFLERNGTRIIASGGTASVLKKNNIKVKKVSSITRFPEVFGGRVKTISPYISGGILGQRDLDKEEAKKNDILWIDMVVCNLYPFEKVAKDPKSSLEDKIENIDIGGPTMIRAAAKNYKWVSVVVDVKDFSSIKKELL